MARKKTNQEPEVPIENQPDVEVSGLSSEPQGQSAAPEGMKRSEDPSREPSIVLPVKNGRFDLETMRERTKKRLEALMLSTYGYSTNGAGKASDATMEAMKPILVQAFFGIWETLKVEALSRKYPKDIVKQAHHYGPAQLAMMQPPSLAMLDKYAPSLEKYSTEAAFLGAFAMCEYSMFQHMRELIEGLPRVIEVTPDKPETPAPAEAVKGMGGL